jgi:hypothetical protein
VHDLTEQQRHNRQRLRAKDLTVRTSGYLTQLVIQDQIMGERSPQHPGGTTDIPLSQVVRYPVATPGGAAAMAPIPDRTRIPPPCEPLYGEAAPTPWSWTHPSRTRGMQPN